MAPKGLCPVKHRFLRVDIRPKRSDNRRLGKDIRSERADFRLERAGLRPWEGELAVQDVHHDTPPRPPRRCFNYV